MRLRLRGEGFLLGDFALGPIEFGLGGLLIVLGFLQHDLRGAKCGHLLTAPSFLGLGGHELGSHERIVVELVGQAEGR